MTKLRLSFAIGNYDRTRALIDGSVTIDGVDPVYMTLVPEEIFFRAFRAAEFDICELSLSSYMIQTARGERPYIAITRIRFAGVPCQRLGACAPQRRLWYLS
jgi:4,5-dihydroxyphthalate decarboxylase